MSYKTKKDLRLLDDLPAESGAKCFQHEMYSYALRDILLSNRPGLSVGLFGKWGQGKSTIIRKLKHLLESDATVVVFNAWKSSGDSLRKQLLLSILEKCDKDEAKRYKDIVGIPDIKHCLDTHQRGRNTSFPKALVEAIKQCFCDKLLRKILLGLFFGFFLLVAVMVCLNQFAPSVFGLLEAAIPVFAVSIVALAVGLLWKKYLTVIGLPEAFSESQILKYPEHFRSAFERLVTSYCKEARNRLVVVIDDLDRCEAKSVVEALSAIRQFADQKNILTDSKGKVSTYGCQFVVPCDEQQVVLALELAGHDAGSAGGRYHDYQNEELLRKFFDVVVRMDRMLPDDLSDYAADLAGEIGLVEKEARELIDIVDPKNPRQVKKLLNALRISHEIVDRLAGNLLPKKAQMNELPATQRLLVALRETVPEAYKIIADNPAYIEGIPTSEEESKAEDSEKQSQQAEKTDAQIARAKAMMARAGRVSKVTATELIYGRLEPDLRPLPSGGVLFNMFMTDDEKGFVDTLLEIRQTDRPHIQAWLQKRTQQAKTDAAARKILNLMMAFVESENHDAPAMIAPCIGTLFQTKSLHPVLSGFKRYQALEILWPHLDDNAKNEATKAIFKNFKEHQSDLDSELSFLLLHANELDRQAASDLRGWMLEQTDKSKQNEVFVRRLHSHLSKKGVEDACRGFAPEVAVVLAGRTQWMDVTAESEEEETTQDPARWPRYNVILTLVGESSEYAARCLAAMFEDNGQLSSPRELTSNDPDFEPAWETVGSLLNVINSQDVQRFFDEIEAWLRVQSNAYGFELVLNALETNAWRLSDNQTKELGDILGQRMRSKTEEICVTEFLGKAPGDKKFKTRWHQIIEIVADAYFDWLRNQNTLTETTEDNLKSMKKYKWPVQKHAEDLLIQKMEMQQTSDFHMWLEVLAPLVGNRRSNLRTAVIEYLETDKRTDRALEAGIKVLWQKEIDIEFAAMLGQFLISHQSEIPEYQDVWNSVKERKGAGKILEKMEEALPSEVDNLINFRTVLDLIAEDLGLLDAKHKLNFIDIKLLALLSADDEWPIQMSVEVADHLPVVTNKFQKKLNQIKDEDFPQKITDRVKSILEKKTF